MLAHIHRHLRYAGIGLGAGGVAPLPSATAPTLADVITESDAFGALSPEERGLLAEHFVAVTREDGETLIHEGEMPEAMFLLTGGAVEVSRGEGNQRQVLLRASPGDSVGMTGLIAGTGSTVTARAVTPVTAYRLDKAAIATVLRIRPALAASLEVQAKRGSLWLCCEAAAQDHVQVMSKPDLVFDRLRDFLRRLNA
jgi:CRP-like cAMP-binding protein